MTDDMHIELRHQADYRFQVDFDQGRTPPLQTDATPPLGEGKGPDAEKLLAAAVGSCLSASLLFAIRKYGNEAPTMHTVSTPVMIRNEKNRLRVGHIDVEIRLGVPAASLKMIERTLAQYEDFCVVTQSVRAGLPVNVKIFDGDGAVLAG